ncbi:MAG: pilus assembly protein PilM [Candidatus Saganbacteria bacterium]|nr:pilus assembly protein PilM [Candidatus Saganbacteria bacterium]
MSPVRDAKTEFSVGFDISGGYIRLAEISESDKGFRLEEYRIAETAREKDGSTSAGSVLDLLKKTFASLPSRKRKIYCLLSGTEVVIRRVIVPKLKEKDLLEAVKWEMKSHIPFTLENTVIDYKMLGAVHERGVEKLDLLVAAVSKESIAGIHGLFESAGINLDGISLAPFAVWDLLKKLNILEKDKTTAFINMGVDSTSLIFFNGENLEFFRELSIAGNNFTKAMIGTFVSDKWQMDFTYEQAEKMKRTYGIPAENTQENTPDGVPLSQISQLLRPVLRRFLNEIIRSFSFYKENFNRTAVDKVILSGGSSKMKSLDTFLSSGLETSVQNFDACAGLESSKTDGEFKEICPHLSIAIGIALSQAKEMNLLKRARIGKKNPAPFNIDRAFEFLSDTDNSIKVPAVTGGAVLLLFIVIAFSAAVMINSRLSYYNGLINDKSSVLANIKLLQERRAIVNRISAEQTPVRQVIAELSNILPPGILLNSFSFTNSSRQMVITGSCNGMKTIGEMLKDIEMSTLFSGTTLIEAKRSASNSTIDFKVIFKSVI